MATKTLEDLCEFITDGTHQTPEYCEDGGYLFLSSKDVTDRRINWDHAKRIPASLHEILYTRLSPRKNDILLAKNGTTGVAAIVDRDEVFDVYVSLAVLRPKQSVFPSFLLYAINSPAAKRQFNAGLKGIGVPNLHLSVIRKTVIQVPSYAEQVEVCERLNVVSQIIENRKKELAALDDLIKARFVEMFSDCKTERLGDFCSTHARIGWQKLTRSEFLETGDYYLVTGWDFDVKNRVVDFSKCYYVTKERYEQDKKLMLKNGDVLLTKDGTLGKVAMVKQLDKPATLNGHIFVIRSLDGRLIPEFLVGALSSDEFKRQMEINKTGSTIVGVTQKALLEFQLPIASIDFQHQFAAFVNQIDKSKFAVQKALNEAQTLFDSLMQQYFG